MWELLQKLQIILMGETFRSHNEFFKMQSNVISVQKQPFGGVLGKRCSENMQQVYRRTPMPKCDFNKVVTLLKSHFGMGILL